MADLVYADGETAVADIDVCRRVADVLQKYYPSHLWMVGCDHQSGVVIIDLPYPKPLKARNMRFMLYISTCIGSDAQKHIRNAGGELLERFGLERDGARPEAYQQAHEHGLNADAAILKSKH